MTTPVTIKNPQYKSNTHDQNIPSHELETVNGPIKNLSSFRATPKKIISTPGIVFAKKR